MSKKKPPLQRKVPTTFGVRKIVDLNFRRIATEYKDNPSKLVESFMEQYIIEHSQQCLTKSQLKIKKR